MYDNIFSKVLRLDILIYIAFVMLLNKEESEDGVLCGTRIGKDGEERESWVPLRINVDGSSIFLFVLDLND